MPDQLLLLGTATGFQVAPLSVEYSTWLGNPSSEIITNRPLPKATPRQRLPAPLDGIVSIVCPIICPDGHAPEVLGGGGGGGEELNVNVSVWEFEGVGALGSYTVTLRV